MRILERYLAFSLLTGALAIPPVANVLFILTLGRSLLFVTFALNLWLYWTLALPGLLVASRWSWRSPLVALLACLPLAPVLGPIVARSAYENQVAALTADDRARGPFEPFDHVELIVHYDQPWPAPPPTTFEDDFLGIAAILISAGAACSVQVIPANPNGELLTELSRLYVRAGADCGGDRARIARVNFARLPAQYRIFHGLDWIERVDVAVGPPVGPGQRRAQPAETVYRATRYKSWLAAAPFLLETNLDEFPMWRPLRQREHVDVSFLIDPGALLQALGVAVTAPKSAGGRVEERKRDFFEGTTSPDVVQTMLNLQFESGPRELCVSSPEVIRQLRPVIRRLLEGDASPHSSVECEGKRVVDWEGRLKTIDCSKERKPDGTSCDGFYMMYDGPNVRFNYTCKAPPKFWPADKRMLSDDRDLLLIQALHRAGDIADAQAWYEKMAPWQLEMPEAANWREARTQLGPEFDASHCAHEEWTWNRVLGSAR